MPQKQNQYHAKCCITEARLKHATRTCGSVTQADLEDETRKTFNKIPTKLKHLIE